MNNDPTPRHADMMIKVCGMTHPDNIADVAALSPMLMGFIFYDRSPRNAIGLDPMVVKSLPHYITPVGVFVNLPTQDIIDTCRLYGIDTVQLHGDESPDQCRRLKDSGLTVIKAIAITDPPRWQALSPYCGAVEMFVFDTPSIERGGSGHKFDWALLDDYPLDVPYLLSGGIGPDDVDAIVAAMRRGMAGIDINSRFETSPGIKNIPALVKFIISLRKFNENEPSTIPFWKQKI